MGSALWKRSRIERRKDMYEDDEMVIDLRVLLYSILKKWYIIMIAGLAGMLVLGAYSMHKSKAVLPTKEQLYKTMEETEINSVETADSMQRNIDKRMQYMDKSLYMKIDPLKENISYLAYCIEDDTKEETIKKMYTNFITSGELAGKVADSYPELGKKEYVQELINDYVIDDENSDIIIEKNNKNSFFTVRILAPKEEQCKKVADIVDKEINEYAKTVQAKYGVHNLKLYSSTFNQKVDRDLQYFKNDYITQTNALKDSYMTSYNAFNDSQKILFAYINDSKDIKDYKPSNSNVKYLIIGLFIGLVCSGGIIFLKDIMENKIYTARQIDDNHLPKVIGAYGKREKSNILAKVLGDECSDSDDRKAAIIAKIKLLSEKAQYSKVSFVVNSKSDNIAKCVNDMITALKEQGVESRLISDMDNSAAAISDMDKSNVVLVVSLGDDKTAQIVKNCRELCSYDVACIGSVCIKG